MVLLAAGKCGSGRLGPPPGGVEIDGDKYYWLVQREAARDIRVEIKRMSNPDVSWRRQDLAPAHEKEAVEAKCENMVPRLCPLFLRGADASPLNFSN